MTRRGPAARGIVAGLSAAVMVGCLLLVGWHRATETHGRCAEHGDELHIESVAGVEASVPRATDLDQAQIRGSGWDVEEGDHHCQILATSHHPVAACSHTPTVEAPPALDRAIPIVIDAAASAAVALYRLAPKTSPPPV